MLATVHILAKGGVIAFTKKTARELGQFNITVNAIAPNTTLTERIQNAVATAKSRRSITTN